MSPLQLQRPDDDLVSLIRVGLNKHVETIVSREDATRRRAREAKQASEAADAAEAARVQQAALEAFFKRAG